MEKILKIGEYSIPLKSTAATLISYKANFGRDGMRDILSLAKGASGRKGADIDSLLDSGFEFDAFNRFLWVLAKAADKGIPPMEEWLETFDIPPIDFVIEALPPVMEMLITTTSSRAKAKN